MTQRKNYSPSRRNAGRSSTGNTRSSSPSSRSKPNRAQHASSPSPRRSSQQQTRQQGNIAYTRNTPAGNSGSRVPQANSQADFRSHQPLVANYNTSRKRRGFFNAIAHFVASFFSFVSAVFGKRVSFLLKIIIAVCLIGAVIFCIDAIRYRDRIFPNVYVGSVNVGGMDAESALKAVDSYYSPLMSSNTLSIYASDEAKRLVQSGVDTSESVADDISVDEAHKNTLVWNVTSADLDGTVPSGAVVQDALAIGRSDGGLFKRITTMLLGSSVPIYGDYSKTALETLAADIDSTIGEARVDSYVEIQQGNAVSYEGHDGYMINRDDLLKRVNTAFLTVNPTESDSSFIAVAEYSPQRITSSEAESAANLINSSISNGAELSYSGTTWKVDRATLGDWTKTEIVQNGSSYRLAALLDATNTQTDLLTKCSEVSGSDAIKVSMKKGEDGSIEVHPSSSSGVMPNVSNAKSELSALLFGTDGLGSNRSTTLPSVQIEQMDIPDSMSFDEAFEEGIVVCISSYTTEYTTGTEARANRNYNIHLCADLINNTICSADGGKWNFNETTGECNQAAGFKSAGIIENGVYTDSYGGGICQVATTVFNSVFEAGYPVPMRFNHSIYPDSYPRGRDAAVDYGGYNLIWQNDSSSDVLLKTSYTDTTVTVDLYGISPRLHVDTTVSDWEEGEEYGQTIYVDSSLPEGTDYIKKQGQDGGSLVTTRYVYDKNNNLIRTDVFNSKYDAEDEVRILGAGEEGETLLKQKKAQVLTDEIKAHL